MIRFIFYIFFVVFVVSSNSFAAVFGAIPNNSAEYERIFGYEPTDGELDKIESIRERFSGGFETLSYLTDFERVLRTDRKLIILVGHNESGQFVFPSGQRAELSDLAEQVERAGKFGVFLTCNGACYTDAPANRLKTSYGDAFTLAAELQHKFWNVDEPPEKIERAPNTTLPLSSTPRSHSSPRMTAKQCAALFSGLKGRPSATAHKLSRKINSDIRREIQRAIFKAEATNLVTASAKIVGFATASTALAIFLSDDD
ncbi:MAG: hypothetical protein AAF526_00155 [Pseudomonadota bacterium]